MTCGRLTCTPNNQSANLILLTFHMKTLTDPGQWTVKTRSRTKDIWQTFTPHTQYC